MLTATTGDNGAHKVKARLKPETALPRVGEQVWLQVINAHTCFYVNEHLVGV